MAASTSKRCPELAPPDAVGQIRQTLSRFLEARLPHGARVCVGVSGGRDSLVLLHALAGLRASGLALSAVHVDHGLSANAAAWGDFCAAFCDSCGVPLEIVRVEVPRASGEGLEAAARRLRHAVFASRDADWLALAHHRDDQAETVLLRLLRGAGVSGAAGMPGERSQGGGPRLGGGPRQGGGPRLIRPLLDLPASLLARYAEECSLRWVEDESNADRRFRRNHLRREVLPRIAAQFPGAAQALARSAQHFSEAAVLLEELAQLDRAAVAGTYGRIDLARFNALAPARARNLLRSELRSAGFRAPQTRWLDEALRQLATAGAASETCVATPDGELHVYRGELYAVLQRPAIPTHALPWHGEAELPWGGGRVSFRPVVGEGVCSRLLAGAAVCLRARQGGERLQPDPRRPTRALRKLLQEAALPPWERLRLPLLWSAERLVWVAGIGVAADFACPPGEAGLTLTYCEGRASDSRISPRPLVGEGRE